MQVREVSLRHDPYVDGLVYGTAWNTTTLTFGFPNSAGFGSTIPEASQGFRVLSPAQQDGIREALRSVSSFTGLSFVELTGGQAGGADLRFGLTSATETAHAYLPTPAAQGGDAWFSSDGTFETPTKGSYAFLTMLHEVGHALGLIHPHEPGRAATVPADGDWMGQTVMSYRSFKGGELGYFNPDGHYAQTYMPGDIAALQHIYGANFAHNAGDTVYSWNPTTGEMLVNGVGQGVPAANVVFQTVWDGGGIDTYDFSGFTPYQTTIDLRPGGWVGFSTRVDLGRGETTPGNIANSYLYKGDQRSLIENVIGTSGHDTIYDNQAINVLRGGPGDDTYYISNIEDQVIELSGQGGGDTLYVPFSYSKPANIERLVLTGSQPLNATANGLGGNITGNIGNNVLSDGGGIGASLAGGRGDDTYYVSGDWWEVREYGNEGWDTVYIDNPNYSLGLYNIEKIVMLGAKNINAVGGLHNVFVEGNDGNNWITGMSGVNLVIGGLGADRLGSYFSGIARYVYTRPEESTDASMDVLADLNAGHSFVDLSRIKTTSLSFEVRIQPATPPSGASSRWEPEHPYTIARVDTQSGTQMVIRIEGLSTIADFVFGDPTLAGQDYDGDGVTDVLLQDLDGSLSVRQAIGSGFQQDAGPPLRAGWEWYITGGGDINGDSMGDVLWRSASGELTYWQSNGDGFDLATGYSAVVGTDWRAADMGDLNGDGMDDIVWRQDGGLLAAWLSTGSGFNGTAWGVSQVSTEWHVEGIGDVNGDGLDDLVWRGGSGAISVWTSTGSGFDSNHPVEFVSPGWHIAGMDDFDGDGMDDLLWRSEGGDVTVWTSNGNGFDAGSFPIQPAHTSWQVAATGDYNGDGLGDILWRNTDGSLTYWAGTGSGFDGITGVLERVDPSWAVFG